MHADRIGAVSLESRTFSSGLAAVRKFRISLLATTAVLSVGVPVAHAQVEPVAPAAQETVPSNAEPSQPQSAADDASTDRVVVTGSLIVRDGFESPTPLSVIGEEQIARSADSNIATFVTNLPAFAGSATTRASTTTGSNGSAGINSLNLRSLGANRTLVLMDGHRVPPALSTGVVDVNFIPQTLISRVDVVTGGASATYGSDAVAGVVNFVLDKSLVGLRGEVSGGQTIHNDGENYKVNLAGGAEFGDGNGNVIFSLEYVDDQGIGPASRDWTLAGHQLMANPAYTATNGQPQRLVYGNVGYMTAAPGGVVSSGPLRGTGFGANGTVYQLNFGDIQADPFMRGGAWEQGDLRRTNAVAPEETRQSAFLRANYEFSDAFNLYGQVSYGEAKAQADLTYVYMIGNSGPLIRNDNAYLPASVRTQMATAGVTTIRVGTFNQDLGITYQITDRSATSYQIGADGILDLFGGDWIWDAYVQRGISNNYVTFPTNISRSRYALAADAVVHPTTGAIVCRSTLTTPGNGCSPYNAMGTGVNDPNGAAVAYIRSPSWSDLELEQSVAAARISGEPFSTWAGPVSVALSAEHRKDTARSTVDAGSLAADHIYANYGSTNGSTDVTEAAVEFIVPLAFDVPWAESLELNGAARFTSYSLAGDVTTWKLGATYSPISDVRFRATSSRDIRAPNLQETFLPQSTARQSIFDPFTNTTPAFDQVTTGNLNLKPEVADTLGVGAVVSPSFIPGFTASVDYWSIDLQDAISVINAANTLLLCYDGSAPQLCSNITRVGGVVTQVISQNINIASQKVRGLDFEASYSQDLEVLGLPGSVNLTGHLTHYLENSIDNGVSAVLDLVGENSGINPPDWRSSVTLGYELDAFRASLTARGLSEGKMFANYIECTSGCPTSTSTNPTINDNSMPGRLYIDLAFSYDFDVGDDRSLTAFFNVRNLTDQDPGLSVTGNAFGNGANNAVLYDMDGTVLRAGVRFRM